LASTFPGRYTGSEEPVYLVLREFDFGDVIFETGGGYGPDGDAMTA